MKFEDLRMAKQTRISKVGELGGVGRPNVLNIANSGIVVFFLIFSFSGKRIRKSNDLGEPETLRFLHAQKSTRMDQLNRKSIKIQLNIEKIN